jgi:hypothetical protein
VDYCLVPPFVSVVVVVVTGGLGDELPVDVVVLPVVEVLVDVSPPPPPGLPGVPGCPGFTGWPGSAGWPGWLDWPLLRVTFWALLDVEPAGEPGSGDVSALDGLSDVAEAGCEAVVRCGLPAWVTRGGAWLPGWASPALDTAKLASAAHAVATPTPAAASRAYGTFRATGVGSAGGWSSVRSSGDSAMRGAPPRKHGVDPR